jgi:tRNA (guanine37-N1)-methyltransferase
MNFYVMTLFPEMIEQGLNTSIIGRAMEKELLTINAVNIRDYTLDKHKRVDDYPYGGGAGMLMAVEPVVRTYNAIREDIRAKTGNTERPRVIYVTPWGKPFHQEMAREFAKEENLVFLCGHYEGIDERALEEVATDFVSIGDYVLTGGELPAMVMIDAISRLIPGVLNNKDSAEYESFAGNLLEHPQYTRPEVYNGRKVPDVLLSGHHANIEKWKKEQSLLRTEKYRPDLLKK